MGSLGDLEQGYPPQLASSGDRVIPGRAVGQDKAGPAATHEAARVQATADAWLSDAGPNQRRSSAGKAQRLKLKNVQDFALIRFDMGPVRGREVLGATLCLHRVGEDKLRYLRVSTVNQDWEEGDGVTPYGPPDGATFLMADGSPRSHRGWAWPGSTAADVIMSAGNSLGCWAERKEMDDGWISVEPTPAMVYAMAVGDSDGLAVMDGGNAANCDNYISSAHDPGHEPYLTVRLGGPLAAAPAVPAVSVAPAPDRAHAESGAIRVAIEPADNVFSWQIQLNGKPVERWQVPHPRPGQRTVFYLDGLEPTQAAAARSHGGLAGRPGLAAVASGRDGLGGLGAGESGGDRAAAVAGRPAARGRAGAGLGPAGLGQDQSQRPRRPGQRSGHGSARAFGPMPRSTPSGTAARCMSSAAAASTSRSSFASRTSIAGRFRQSRSARNRWPGPTARRSARRISNSSATGMPATPRGNGSRPIASR